MWNSNCHPIRVIWHGWRNEGLGGLGVMKFFFFFFLLYRNREVERRGGGTMSQVGDQFKRCDHKGNINPQGMGHKPINSNL